jgi:large subunit ribosomal protein L10
MNRAERQSAIDEIRTRFDRMVSAVFVDFNGMTVEEVSKLRDELRKSGVEYRVVKNTLVKHAIKDRPYAAQVTQILHGMTGIAWSYEEPGAAAKVLKNLVKENQKLKIKAGLVETTVLPPSQVEDTLATMPGKDELRATLLATLLAPAQNFVALLNAPAQNFAYLLDAQRRKLAGES